MIGLVTVTFDSEPVLPDFLDSVRHLETPVRVYAVDNDSTDASLELLERANDLDLVVLAQSENLGIAVGNNIGIRRALRDGCDWIVLINNDTEFEPDLVARLLAAAEAADALVVVPSIRFHEHPEQVWFEAARYANWRGSVPVALPPAEPGSITPIECACTCCALVHKSVFEEIGLMDEAYFVYWDDTDFFLRSWRAGIPMVLDAGATMLHKVSTLTGGGESEFSQRQRIKNRTYFVRKHSRRLRRSIALLLTLANLIKLTASGAGRRRRATVLWRAFRDGLRMPVTPPID